MPSLSDLCSKLPVEFSGGEPESCEITGVSDDSREVKEGHLFAAIKGNAQDGAEYIPQAVEQGALAVLTRPGVELPKGVIGCATEKERTVLAKLAARFYAPQPKHVVAITGTDGKTSTAEFFRQMMEAAGSTAASLGTLGLKSESVKVKAPAINTSPDPVLLHKTLQRLAEKKCEYVALEASSHGLDQHRMDGVELSAAAFTTFTRDHLDYHRTEARYFEAKMRLFRELLPRASNVVANPMMKHYEEIIKVCRLRKHTLITYGEQGDLRLEKVNRFPSGLQVQLNIHGVTVEAELKLIGAFQVMNILAAMGLGQACGRQVETLRHVLHYLKPVRGRLEQVNALHGGQSAVYIDYAHTPSALEKALQELRGHCQGKLYVVFGCGGDRDPGKRPLMGKVASELADKTFITDDNPRSENAATIRKEVYAGAERGKATRVGDRRKAIAAALNEMQQGDVLLVAGKGHETYQIVGDEKLPFDDAKVVKSLVK